MTTRTELNINLSSDLISWNSLQDIHDDIRRGHLSNFEGHRYLILDGKEIPLTKVINEIYTYRPNFLTEERSKLELYFDTTKKFVKLFPPQVSERSILKKITDCLSNCFWGCYGPIQICWCTSGCKENVIIADSKLGVDGVYAWKEHIQESSAS